MKVCMLARSFNLGRGGVARVGLEIRNGVEAAGHTVTTITAPEGGLFGYAKFSLVDCRKLPEANVYHAITPVEGLWLPADCSVVTFHDLFLLRDASRCGAGVGYNGLLRDVARRYWKVCTTIASRARALVAVSEQTKEDMQKYLNIPGDRIRVIRSGIPDFLDYVPREPHTRMIFGYLGQLDKRKRVDVLIESFLAANIDSELWIGGTGIDEPKLKSLAGHDPRIKFFGMIPEWRLCEFYNLLDWFIFPSAIEGYGLPPVEAMACKVPVVVLEDAIIPNEIKRRCIVTEDLVSFLMSAESFNFIGSEDNYRFAKAHDWARAIREYINIYEEVKR